MADDYVPASPIALKAKKRKGGFLQRRAKKLRGKKEQISAQSSSNTEKESNQHENESRNEASSSATFNDVNCEQNLDITALYWPESDGEQSRHMQNFDIFYEARILEEANYPLLERTCKIPLELVKEQFVTLGVLSQQIEPKTPRAEERYETQFPADSEFISVCQVADAVSDLHHFASSFSQWNSPTQKTVARTSVQDPPPATGSQESGEGCSFHGLHSAKIVTTTPKAIPKSSPKAGTSYARQKYGHEIEKAARKRITFFDDSDSKSSLSSELSLQINNGVQFTPLDEIDLNQSLHAQENLHNLSSFFSQSFVQDDVDTTTNGIFRYIMLLKSKRKNAKMIHWFRSGKNFEVNDTRSSKSFEGFPSGEMMASTSIVSDGEDVCNLLGVDDEFFAEFSDGKWSERSRSAAGLDVDSIAKSSDPVLQEISEDDAKRKDDTFNKDICPKRNEPPNGAKQDVNIETLLNGHILATPKMAKLSESTIPECSQWIMRPKMQNSITASDIEWDTGTKFKEATTNDDINSVLDTTFIISKSPIECKRKISNDTIQENVENVSSLDRANILKIWDSKQSDASLKDEYIVPHCLKNDLQDTSKSHCGYYSFFEKTPVIPKYHAPPTEKGDVTSEKIENILAQDIQTVVHSKSDETRRKAIRNRLKENLLSPALYNASNISNISVRNNDGKNQNQITTTHPETASKKVSTGYSSASVSIAVQQNALKSIPNIECDLDKYYVKDQPDLEWKNSVCNKELYPQHPPHANLSQTTGNKSSTSNTTREKRKRILFPYNHEADNIENMSSVANSELCQSSLQEVAKNPISIMNEYGTEAKNCIDAPTPFQANHHINPPVMLGFQFLSGKKITISEKAKKRAMQMVQEEMNDFVAPIFFEDSLKKNDKLSTSGPIASEEESLLKENPEEFTEVQRSLAVSDMLSINRGFKTAFRSPITGSNATCSKAENMAEVESCSVEPEVQFNCQTTNFFANNNMLMCGFQSASKKPIYVSKTALAKATKFMAGVGDDVNNVEAANMLPTLESPVKQSAKVGFQSASRKTISNDLAKAEETMADEEDDAFLTNLKLSQINSPLKRKNASHVIEVTKNGYKSVHENFSKGQTARESTSLIKRVLRSNSIEGRTSGVVSNSPRISPLAISSANKPAAHTNSVKVRRKDETSCSSPIRIQSPLAASLDTNSLTPQRGLAGVVPSKSRLSLSNRRFKPPGTVPDQIETPIRPIPLHLQVATPNFQNFFDSAETSTPKNQAKSRARQNIFTLSQEVSACKEALLEDEAEVAVDQKSIRKINWGSEVDEVASRVSNIINVPTEIGHQRATKRNEQSKIIRNKSQFQGFIKAGDHFVKKTQPNRMKLNQLQKCRQKVCIAPVKIPNLLDYKFNSSLKLPTIPTEDGAYIVPDDHSNIGFVEIKNAFLSLPSVALSLIPPNWIRHHYEMILHKLRWLEAISPGFLTPQNVCLQLKYRYDHELDRAHRSTLRRILECDDSPAKRMVLSVLAIHNSNFNDEIELTDRWYSVRVSIDPAMQSLIDSGKVKVGTKLMIQSAELLNCDDGCNPLEVPANVRLKVNTNSTRRARWDTKLGFYKIPRPFLLSLDQVRINGTMVSRLELCILRVYPSVYLRSGKADGNVSEFHSEKVEQQLRSIEDVSKLSNIETVFSQVQKELDTEDRKSSKNSFLAKKNIKEISNPAELYDLVRCEGDTSEIESELSCIQRTLLSDYQQQIYAERMRKVQTLVQAKLQKQPSCEKSKELLKLRVVDYRKPNTTALLSIWSPRQELKNLLQERTVLEATHLIPKDHSSYELQLTSTKSSQFKRLQSMITNGKKHQRNTNPIPENYHRHVTPIEETYSSTFKPAFNELDTYGLIVMIGDDGRTHHPKRFQPVYLADTDGNILCLNFWIGIKEYGFEDVIQVHRFIAANNLQWRSNSGCGPIRIAFVTSTTSFTEKPRNQDILYALDTMKAHFQSNHSENTWQFIEKCRGKINEIKSRPKNTSHSAMFSSTSLNASNNSNNTNNSSMTSHASTSMNANKSLNNSSTFGGRISVQERMEKLKTCIDPPDLSPLHLRRTRSVRKAFKLPANVAKDRVG